VIRIPLSREEDGDAHSLPMHPTVGAGLEPLSRSLQLARDHIRLQREARRLVLESRLHVARSVEIRARSAAIRSGAGLPPASAPSVRSITPAPSQRLSAERPSSVLTPRELQFLALIAGGMSSKQAAFKMGISHKTGQAHRYNLMSKIGLHDTASLVRYAIRHGLVEA
jgi:DNA-binding NarL/FixJ family response regulator